MKKILIVEDEEVLREMYVEKFTQEGYKVLGAEDAEKGLEIARREKPDLVLLDILLPKENGVFLLGKLKNDPATTNLKVLAFSNFDDPQTKRRAKELGALDYLIKTNYTPKQIVERVKEYLK